LTTSAAAETGVSSPLPTRPNSTTSRLGLLNIWYLSRLARKPRLLPPPGSRFRQSRPRIPHHPLALRL
jgi:hypothetical protein